MKERLTGANILVALLVLLVPELLSGPSRGASPAPLSHADGTQMRSYTINLADDSSADRAADVAAVETPAPQMQGAGAGASPRGAEAPVSGTGSVAAETRGAEQGDDGSERSGSAQRSSAAGKTAERAAPAASRPPQSSAAPPQPGNAPGAGAQPEKPAAAPAHTETEKLPAATARAGWAVQVGSFASRANAERLARDLKGKGFAATVSEATSKGRRLWRVRVGPEADRDAAAALRTKLRAAGQTGGAVVPYP